MNRQKLRVLPYVAALLPLDILVGLSLLAAALAGGFFRRRQGQSGPLDSRSSRRPARPPSVTIIIVNWDGRHLLEESLPSVVASAGASADILVVDNGSRDGSVQFVRDRYPGVRVLALDRNYGFAGGNNRGVRAAATDIVVFLNNDMIVDPGFLQPLLDGFDDPSVFAVTSQIFLADDSGPRVETGNTRARFDRGFVSLAHVGVQSSECSPVFWAGGGSSAVDRAKFVEIGGFDPLYNPFYVEDLDLSYQAWKRGWKSILAPQSRVVHKHRGTSRPKFGNRFVDNTIRRNQYLFIWKNVTDFSMLLEHLLNLPRIHGRAMLESEPGLEARAFIRAVRRLPEALWKRLSNLRRYALSDREVLARIPKS